MSKPKEDVAVKQILQYMIDQNRPYSVIDIYNNLHKEHSKTVVSRALEQLFSEQKIVEKAYGKQKIYFANQSNFPETTEEDLKAIDTEINNVNEELSEELRKIKMSENLALSLSHSLTTEEAKKDLKAMNKDILILQEKLKTLESKKNFVKPEEQKMLQSNKEKYYREFQKRKRIGSDMLDAILESYPNGKKQLCEEIGVETDEGYEITKLS